MGEDKQLQKRTRNKRRHRRRNPRPTALYKPPRSAKTQTGDLLAEALMSFAVRGITRLLGRIPGPPPQGYPYIRQDPPITPPQVVTDPTPPPRQVNDRHTIDLQKTRDGEYE